MYITTGHANTYTTDVHTLCNNDRSTNVLELHKSSFTYFILTDVRGQADKFSYPFDLYIPNKEELHGSEYRSFKPENFRPIMKKSLAVVNRVEYSLS